MYFSPLQIIGTRQNLTLELSPESVGVYFCHASSTGFAAVTSQGADVLVNGPPRISSPDTQFGVVGLNVQINCASLSVPPPTRVEWLFHGKKLSGENPHYRIIDSPRQNGRLSTLIVKESLSSDFGTYSCIVHNAMGASKMHIDLEQETAFPLYAVLIGAFTAVILILVTTIFCIICRRKICCCRGSNNKSGSSAAAAAANNLIVANSCGGEVVKSPCSDWANGDDQADDDENGFNSNGIIGGSVVAVNHHPVSNGTEALLLNHHQQHDVEPDFPPKQPDVVASGYVPYGSYVRQFNPPPSLSASSTSTLLNVSDPRFSAVYGNPYLNNKKLINASSTTAAYSTFLPAPIPPPSSSSVKSGVSGNNNRLLSSTPTSSVTNMVCLPEEHPPTPAALMMPPPPPSSLALFQQTTSSSSAGTSTSNSPPIPMTAKNFINGSSDSNSVNNSGPLATHV